MSWSAQARPMGYAARVRSGGEFFPAAEPRRPLWPIVLMALGSLVVAVLALIALAVRVVVLVLTGA